MYVLSLFIQHLSSYYFSRLHNCAYKQKSHLKKLKHVQLKNVERYLGLSLKYIQKILKVSSVDWITPVKYTTLLDVLKFDSNKITDNGVGNDNEEAGKTVEEELEVGDEVKVGVFRLNW